MLNPQRLNRVEGSHLVSEMDYDPEVQNGFDFPTPLELIDSTIRKSFFTAGAVTSGAGYQRIAEALGGLGIRVECINVNWSGSPQPAPQDLAVLQAVTAHDFGFAVNVYADALLGNGQDPQPVSTRQAIETLIEAGARVLAPGIVQAPSLDAEKRQLDQLDDYFELAAEFEVTTTITLAQVGLRDFDRLVGVARHAVSRGATRLDLMDSTSSMSPEAMRVFVRRFREQVGSDVAITMHMHDEFGLATAGAIAAATAGASPDVAVNGMSYRCGFAPLEEVVLALETLYGVDTGIELAKIMDVSRVVERETGISVPALKPLVGGYAYLKHMPGDAAAAIRTGQSAFPPISHGLTPSAMGQRVSWVWGGLSSDSMVEALADQLGERLTEAEIATVRRALDAEVAAVSVYPRWLDEDEAVLRFRQALSITREVGTDPETIIAGLGVGPALADRLGIALKDVDVAAFPAVIGRTVSELDPDAALEALDAFRPFDQPDAPATGTASATEEGGIEPADRLLIAQLARRYQDRFGFPFVVAAEGRSGLDVLSTLAHRMGQDRSTEIDIATAEAAAILQQRARALLCARLGS
ncbi:MAG TPA: 2-oxo-4-hydroxy-4-carboxy-5-ureidoimidazoline decarboxylase [Microlunatus sp.]